MKSLEQQLTETQQELRNLRKTGKTAGKLVQDLSESGLPPAAQTRLAKRFESAANLDGLPKAINEEKEYIHQVRKATARNNAGRTSEVNESDERKRRLAEGYRSLGLSESESALAANVEDAVEGMQESQQQLYESARAMGMNEEEAKVFSEPNRSSSW